MKVLTIIALLLALGSGLAVADEKEDCAGGDIEKRLEGCTAIIDTGKLTDQDMAFAYINRGDALFAKNDYYQAIDDFGKAIELYPKDAKPYNNRAYTYLTLRRPEDGLPDAQKAVELEPENANAWDTLGTIYVWLKQKDKAIEALKKANALDPEKKLGSELLAKLEAIKKPE